MARRAKKPVHHVQMTDGKRAIIQQLLQEYDIETVEDVQDALKDLLGGTIKEMMVTEMDDHLGYAKSERINHDDQSDYRNGTKRKQVNTSSPRRISGLLQVRSSVGVSSVFFQNPVYPELHIVPVHSLSERQELRLLHHAAPRCNFADQK